MARWSEAERERFAALLRPAERVLFRERSEDERDGFEARCSFSEAVHDLVEGDREWDRWEGERRIREARIMDAAFRRFIFRDGGERLAPWAEARGFVSEAIRQARARAEAGARRPGGWDSFLSWCVLQTMEGPFVLRRPGREDALWNWFPGWCDERGIYGPRVAAVAARLVAREAERLREAHPVGRVVKPRPATR